MLLYINQIQCVSDFHKLIETNSDSCQLGGKRWDVEDLNSRLWTCWVGVSWNVENWSPWSPLCMHKDCKWPFNNSSFENHFLKFCLLLCGNLWDLVSSCFCSEAMAWVSDWCCASSANSSRLSSPPSLLVVPGNLSFWCRKIFFWCKTILFLVHVSFCLVSDNPSGASQLF